MTDDDRIAESIRAFDEAHDNYITTVQTTNGIIDKANYRIKTENAKKEKALNLLNKAKSNLRFYASKYTEALYTKHGRHLPIAPYPDE